MSVAYMSVCEDPCDYHQGNTAGLQARWSLECVHTALRRTPPDPCTVILKHKATPRLINQI